MKLFRSVLSLSGCLILAGSSTPIQSVQAASLSLGPSADACLFEHDPNNNLGASTHLASGTIRTGHRSRVLCRFDLGQIPATATIESVALSLKVVITPPGGPSSIFGLYRMLTSWSEGVGAGNRGSSATASEVTWNTRGQSGLPWSSPGGAIGSDYATSASAALVIAGNGTCTFGTSAGLVNDVQEWIRNPESNFGWMLLCQSEGTAKSARRFAAREDAANAPTLVIQYSVPPAPLVLAGRVLYYDGLKTVSGVTIDLSGSKTDSTTTASDGTFSFSVDQNGSYIISPSKPSDPIPSAGDASLSITFSRRHILGKAKLDSPYKLLAADLNNSGSVTTLDHVWRRRVNLGLDTGYPAGFWKFVASDFIFADPALPWIYESNRMISNPTSNQSNLDFIAIRLGDLNASWTPP